MAEQSLKDKKVSSGLFTNKLGLLAISLLPVWLVLFVKDVDIPIYLGQDWQFVGWGRLLNFRNIVAATSFVMTLNGIASLLQLLHRTEGTPDGLTTAISIVGNRNYDYVNTLATIVTLLGVILVPVDTLRGFLVFAILMILIIVCYTKTNLYYCNPIFAALGFRLYTVNGKGLQEESIAIYRGALQNNRGVRFYHISDNVYFLI